MTYEEILTGTRVSAHRPDRMGSVVVGELMPYDATQGERVRDDNGVVWCVVAASVRPVLVMPGETPVVNEPTIEGLAEALYEKAEEETHGGWYTPWREASKDEHIRREYTDLARCAWNFLAAHEVSGEATR